MRPVTRGLALAALLAAAACPPGFSQRYTVLTYNAGLLRVAGIDLVPAVCARERLLARELAGFASRARPDIVLLQEAWKNRDASAVVDALRPLGYSSVRPRGCGAFTLGSGLLLLVREPLRVVEWTFVPFSKRTGLDAFAQKGVFSAVLEDPAAGGARFALLGTHTIAVDTVDGVPKDPKQFDTFLAQAAELRRALDAAGGGTLPAMLLGDFNVGPGYADDGYRAIAGAPGLVEAGESFLPGAPSPTWDPGNPLVRLGRYPLEPAAKIDHVFLRPGAERGWIVIDARRVFEDPVEGLFLRDKASGREVPSPLSDHYGFLVVVEVGGAR